MGPPPRRGFLLRACCFAGSDVNGEMEQEYSATSGRAVTAQHFAGQLLQQGTPPTTGHQERCSEVWGLATELQNGKRMAATAQDKQLSSMLSQTSEMADPNTFAIKAMRAHGDAAVTVRWDSPAFTTGSAGPGVAGAQAFPLPLPGPSLQKTAADDNNYDTSACWSPQQR